MASDEAPRFAAQFFDGETAVTRRVTVTAGSVALSVADGAAAALQWSYAGLIAIEPPSAGHPMRLSHQSQPGARLILPPEAQPLLLARAPQLRGGINPSRLLRIAVIFILCLAALGAAGYGVLTLAPQTLARMMPDSWRERLGEQTEASFVSGAKQCESAKGAQAIDELRARVVENLKDSPEFSVRVFDMPMINAFALPGGRIVLTRGLVEKAGGPDEVAGVLAHELGHVAMRHPEAQLVRVLGLQILLTIASGGGSDAIGNLAGLLAILRYTRSAEREADDYAQLALEEARIDPLGLKRFLEAVRRDVPNADGGLFSGLGNILSTHPGIDERIARMRPLPEGPTRPALDPDTWKNLNRICE